MTNSKCCFCQSEARYSDAGSPDFYHFECPVCNDYLVSKSLYDKLCEKEMDNSLVSCASDNVKTNTNSKVNSVWLKKIGDEIPGNSENIIIRYFSSYEGVSIDHSRKTTDLFTRIIDKIGPQKPFCEFTFEQPDLIYAKIMDFEEAYHWVDELCSQRVIFSKPYEAIKNQIPWNPHLIKGCKFQVTPDGWSAVRRLQNSATPHGFVAMAFSHPERKPIEDAIRNACTRAGFEALVIDRHEYNGGVVDEIMAKINLSRFVISELTGHKNGVYFEAGYAMGRGLPVIFALQDVQYQTDAVHFDVQHLNQIRWKSYEELSERIYVRLVAMFK